MTTKRKKKEKKKGNDEMFGSFLPVVSLLLAPLCAALSPNPFYYGHWCNGEAPNSLQFLDDKFCQKAFPSNLDRNLTCSASSTEAHIANLNYSRGFGVGRTAPNVTGLADVLGEAIDGVDMAVIIVKRVGGVPFFRLLATDGALVPHETWSSSKIFGVATASSVLEGACGDGLGLSVEAAGGRGNLTLGDLVTVITTYDTTAGFTSNSLARWFSQSVAGQRELGGMLKAPWLAGNATLGGSYGEPPPQDLSGLNFQGCVLPARPAPVPIDNSLDLVTAAAWMRAIVLLRDLPEDERVPGLRWDDARTMLYGAPTSESMFKGATVGGMAADTAIFVQSGIPDIKLVDGQSQGGWRIFSKLGAGYSATRQRGEILGNNYACLPGPDGGVEFIVSARSSVPGDTSLASAEERMQRAVAALTSHLIAHQEI